MAFVQFSQISLAFGDRDILKDITLTLAAGTRAALAGANGSGKTTLLKVFAGSIEADSGSRSLQKGTRVSYLPQSGIVHRGKTVREEVESAFVRGEEIQKELDRIGSLLAEDDTIAQESKTAQLLEDYHALQTELEESGFHRRKMLSEQTLAGLGFSQSDCERDVSEFSGGWQMRIALAKVLLENPDILLLDEPTNYLDLEARNWLEQWLHDFSGGFLLVSHDRYFLDVTVTDVYELFNGVLHRYPGNYSHYENVRRVELESLIARYEIQQEEIRKLEDFIRRFHAKATKAAAAQERMKKLDKMERIEIPESLKKIRFRFPQAPHAGRIMITAENIRKCYDVSLPAVLQNLDLVIENGDRLVVVGRNGAGKSTFLRIIAGADTSFDGRITLGSGVSIGYFSQDNAEKITGDCSIIEMMESEAPTDLIPKVRDLLGAFLFRGDDIYKPLSVLSGGEKSRLALLRLLLKPVNLLILDEPTNHLDLHSKDVLLEALQGFGGTIVFVSHDRSFIEQLATRVVELGGGSHRLFVGDYHYYLERLARETQNESIDVLRKVTATSNSFMDGAQVSAAQVNVALASAAQISREENKKRETEQRRRERESARLLGVIEQVEQEKERLVDSLSDPSVYCDGEKCRNIQSDIKRLSDEIDTLTAEWERYA